MTASQSRRNFAEACKRAKVGMALPIVVDKPLRTALGPSIFQQERDFQNAVQPGSPISALLQCVPYCLMLSCLTDLQIRSSTPCPGTCGYQGASATSQTLGCRSPIDAFASAQIGIRKGECQSWSFQPAKEDGGTWRRRRGRGGRDRCETGTQ